jgi:hypothetical protein
MDRDLGRQMASSKARRQKSLTRTAANKLVAAAQLRPAHEPRFREWLQDTDERYLEHQISISADLTLKGMKSKFERIERLSARLHKELQHTLIRHYFEIDRVRSEAVTESREKAHDLARELCFDIDAIERIRARSVSAIRGVTADIWDGRSYFGNLPAQQPDISELIRAAQHVWLNVLGRPPKLTAAYVNFVHVVLIEIAGRPVTLETVRSRLRACRIERGSQGKG